MPLESSRSTGDHVEVFDFEEFRADLRKRKLLCNGQSVAITSKAFDTLAFLLRRHGTVVEKDHLMQAIWPDTVVEEGNLHHYVSSLRKVLGEKPGESRFIATVPGQGYSFVAPVRVPVLDATPAVAESSAGVSQPLKASRRYVAWGVTAGVTLVLLASWSVANRIRPGKPTPRPLTASLGVADMASFSPDGQRVVFSWRGEDEPYFHLYTKSVDAEDMRQITFGPGDDVAPAWSPDGLRIAFGRRLPGAAATANEYCLMPAQGGPVTTLTRGMVSTLRVPIIAWLPDGKHLIINTKARSDDPARLYLLALDSKELRALTFPTVALGDNAPVISGDGQLLAFLRSAADGEQLHVMPALGGQSRIVASNQELDTPPGLAWTPDSRALIYRSIHGGFVRIPLEGGQPEPLGLGSAEARYPATTPKGRLAFTEPARQIVVDNFTFAANGQAPVGRTKTLESTRTARYPSWSPDGKRFAFSSDRSGSQEIWRSDADGGNLLRLTSFNGPLSAVPRWSPDGKSIAFLSMPGGNTDIYVISAEGGTPRRMTTEASADVAPAWSMDSKTIYFGSDRSGAFQIWKMPAAGGTAEQVTFEGGNRPHISPDGYLYYVKGWTARSVWRRPIEGGKEEVVLNEAMHSVGMWGPAAGGVYYIDQLGALRFFDVRSRHDSGPLVEFPRSEIKGDTGIGVASDGHSVLVPRVRESGTNIMIVDRFR